MAARSRVRKRMKKLDAEIARRYRAVESLRAIARRISKSHEFVRNVMIRMRIPRRSGRRRPVTVHDAEVARRYKARATALAIAESLPICLDTVRRTLIRLASHVVLRGDRAKVDDARIAQHRQAGESIRMTSGGLATPQRGRLGRFLTVEVSGTG